MAKASKKTEHSSKTIENKDKIKKFASYDYPDYQTLIRRKLQIRYN